MPPIRFFLPNSFTALSMLLGLASVAMSVSGNFELAAWMILWGTLLDKLDGTAARLVKATSDFGVQFDSFADFVAFGIAPAALIYYRLLQGGDAGDIAPVPMAAAGLYVLALAVRLARFNITTGGEKIFFGIPGTLVGAVIASGYLTFAKYELIEPVLRAAPAVLVISALLMISTVRIPKLTVRKNKALNIFQYGNVAAAYVCGPLMIFPEYLFGLAAVYTVGGVVWCVVFPPKPDVDDEVHEQPV